MHVLDLSAQPDTRAIPSPRRLGRFLVPSSDFEQWETLKPLMSQMIVIATNFLPEENAVEYTAFCEKFEAIRANKVPPLYDYKIESRPNGSHLFMRKAPHQ